MSDRAALVGAVRRAIEETHAELEELPFFVRPMVRRGFVKRTGLDRAQWLRVLDDAARGATPAGLGDALGRLAVRARRDRAAIARARRRRARAGNRPRELTSARRRADQAKLRS